MNRLGWGPPNPFNTEVTAAINKEQGPKNGYLIEEANRAQMRRFHRVEALKMLGVIVGSLILIVIALFIFSLFVK